MAELWYYTSEGKQMDPVSMKELRRLVTDGVLKPTDMVWKEGMARWIRASSVKELYPDPTAALDHFFTHTKLGAPTGAGTNSTSSTGVTAGTNSKTAPAAGASSSASADDDAAEPGPRRRRSSDDEAKGGGGGLILLILGVLAAGFLLVCLVVGVGILIFVASPGEPEAQQPIAQVDPKDKDKKPKDPPEKKEIKQEPLPADVKSGVGSFQTTLGPGKQEEFKLRVRAGHNASITVTNHTKPKATGTVDFNLLVFKTSNGAAVISDTGPDTNANVQFSLPNEEIVNVRVINASTFGPKAKCTIQFNGG